MRTIPPIDKRGKHNRPIASEMATSSPDATQADQLRPFYYSALREVTGDNYLIREWLPRKGPWFVALIQALRQWVSEQQTRKNPVPFDLNELARRCGVSRATVSRWLARQDRGRGPFVDEDLGRFLKIKHHYQVRKEQAEGGGLRTYVQQTCNEYWVAMDDPTVPEHDHLVRALEHALQARWASPTAQDGYQKAASATIVTYESQNETHSPTSLESQNEIQGETTSYESHFETAYRRLKMRLHYDNDHYDNDYDTKGQVDNKKMSTRKGRAAKEDKKALVGGQAGASSARQAGSTVDLMHAMLSSEPSPRDLALAEAERRVGAYISALLESFGGVDISNGTNAILEALVDAGTPGEVLMALVDVAKTRLRQQQELGRDIGSKTGYFITIMRDLAARGREQGWNVSQIAREDQARFSEQLRAAYEQQASQVEEQDAPSDDDTAEECPPVVGADVEEGTSFYGEVELLDAPRLATLSDTVPDPHTGQPRSLSMLWGFVCQELEPKLSTTRRYYLQSVTPKWDPERPAVLLLSTDSMPRATFVQHTLRADILPRVEKQLAPYFSTYQVVYTPSER